MSLYYPQVTSTLPRCSLSPEPLSGIGLRPSAPPHPLYDPPSVGVALSDLFGNDDLEVANTCGDSTGKLTTTSTTWE